MCFKHYNPAEVVMGRSMEEWLRFSVCFWHTFRGTGQPSVELCKPGSSCNNSSGWLNLVITVQILTSINSKLVIVH